MYLLKGHDFADQLVDIFDPALRILIIGELKLPDIAGGLDNIPDQIPQPIKFLLTSENLNHIHKAL